MRKLTNLKLAKNLAQMEDAIPKFKRQIKKLEGLDVRAIIQHVNDINLVSLQKKMNDTLKNTFGADTKEYREREARRLAVAAVTTQGPSLREVEQKIKAKIKGIMSVCTGIIPAFKEKLDDFWKTQNGKALKTFGNSALHPEIDKASTKLFKDKHYAHAIENACKALDLLVKLRSGRNDLDGRSLMQKVFGSDKPILKFNELKTTSEKNEQQGMMFLFAGVMSALRNPRAHGFIDDDPENTLEQILFISFLAKSLDKTEKQN